MNLAYQLCMGCMSEKGTATVCPACGWRETESASSVSELPPRSVLNGTYLTGRVVGEGGFGITYIGWDLKNRRKVAVKEYFPRTAATRTVGTGLVTPLSPQFRDDFEYGLKRFSEESQVLTIFRNHPCIVSFLDFQNANGTAYLVMEFLDGRTLAAYLRERGGRISCDTALKVMMRVLDGLREVHSHGLLHRDLSPENIFLTQTNSVKLLDFGAARFALGERSQNLSVILKPGYAPPEQYLRRGRQGPQTDIYAAAATFYRSVTGKVPPDALERQTNDTLEPLGRLGVQAQPHVERALTRAMSLGMRERFAGAQEFQQALRGAVPEAPPGRNKVEPSSGIRPVPNVFLVYAIGTLLAALVCVPLALTGVFKPNAPVPAAPPAPTNTRTANLSVNYGTLAASLRAGRVVGDVSFQIQPFQGRTGCALLALVDERGKYVEASPGKMFQLLRDFTSASDRTPLSVHFDGPAPLALSAGASGGMKAQAILFANPCNVQDDPVISRSGVTPLR